MQFRILKREVCNLHLEVRLPTSDLRRISSFPLLTVRCEISHLLAAICADDAKVSSAAARCVSCRDDLLRLWVFVSSHCEVLQSY
jgi:hypothetical protein